MEAAQKKRTTKTDNNMLTAGEFFTRLSALCDSSISNEKHYRGDDPQNVCMGVRMGNIFALAKEFIAMPIAEVSKLLDNKYYEARMGAVSIMDFKARDKKTTETGRKLLYELYIKKHNRITNWDMVDRSAPYVVGGYLYDKPRDILYKLAVSKNEWERRTAIVSTYFFIRKGDVDDTFKIAELMVNDKQESVNKAVGSWVREAGKKDRVQLLGFLDRHAATMPRITLRYALEKLDMTTKNHYMNAYKTTVKK